MELVTRYFSFDEVTADQGWMLLNWCRAAGAVEFTLTGLVAGKESPRMHAFFAALAPVALQPAARRTLRTPKPQEVALWQLTDTSVALLREALPMGFTSREFDTDLWLEDLAVYRNGEFMMGVVSHESGGVLRLGTAELADLRAARFPDRDEVPWIRF